MARKLRSPQRLGLTALTAAIVVIANFPVIFMVLNSLQTTEQLMTKRSFIPTHPTLANFVYLSARTSFWTYLQNSLTISSGCVVLTLASATLAGYALSRFGGRWLVLYAKSLFVVQMFPIILALIPLFVLFRKIGLMNSPIAVILLYTVFQLPFATWMARSFFDTIPKELEEAAMVDGCSRLRVLVFIVLPLSAPGIAAISIFSFLFSYNEFFVANIFLRDESAMTLPVGITMFMQQYATDWGSLMAAATVTLIPTFLLFLGVQKYMAYGAVGSGVKG